MTLLDKIRDAEHQIVTYKHPNIDEVRKIFNDILDAMGGGGPGNDSITSLYIHDNCVTFNTEYWVRGCHCGNDYTIPMDILEAEDPIKAAKLYHIEKRIIECNQAIAGAEFTLRSKREQLVGLNLELQELK